MTKIANLMSVSSVYINIGRKKILIYIIARSSTFLIVRG